MKRMLYAKVTRSSAQDVAASQVPQCIVDSRLMDEVSDLPLTSIRFHNINKGKWLQTEACIGELHSPSICISDELAPDFEYGDLCVVYAVSVPPGAAAQEIPFVFGRFS